MAILNQFQQYSQGENTVTNNILLMLSNLYDIRPKYYEEFIKGLVEDENYYEVIPTFRQQIGNRGDGIIDGFIQTKATKIVIETKLNGLESVEKLLKYTKSYDEFESKILIHLSSQRYEIHQVQEIKKRLSEFNLGKISFHSLTYQDLVDQLKYIASTYSYEHYLLRLSEHFESYCLGMRLIPQSNHILRAMACGDSFDLNLKHKFYFDLASRGFSDFKYLGIYGWKAVRFIGLVENEIVADWDAENGLLIKSHKKTVTEEQRNRLIAAIQDALSLGWGIDSDHRFFLMSETADTEFIKKSPGGIFRVRYFDLEEVFEKVPSDIKEIGEKLRTETWQ